jgi:hypothetical protein
VSIGARVGEAVILEGKMLVIGSRGRSCCHEGWLPIKGNQYPPQ